MTTLRPGGTAPAMTEARERRQQSELARHFCSNDWDAGGAAVGRPGSAVQAVLAAGSQQHAQTRGAGGQGDRRAGRGCGSVAVGSILGGREADGRGLLAAMFLDRVVSYRHFLPGTDRRTVETVLCRLRMTFSTPTPRTRSASTSLSALYKPLTASSWT